MKTHLIQFKTPQIYAIVDDQLHHHYGLKKLLQNLVENSSIYFIQIRSKKLTDEELIDLIKYSHDLKQIRPYCLILNDRCDIWFSQRLKTAWIDGFHLGQSDLTKLSLSQWQELHHHFIVGITAKTDDHIQDALSRGAHYIGTGALFPTTSKEGIPVLGSERLATLAKQYSIPLVAIGGINQSNLHIPKNLGLHSAIMSGLLDNNQFIGNVLCQNYLA